MEFKGFKDLPDTSTPLSAEYMTAFLNAMYPIGKIEIFYDAEDHSNYMGCTWEKILPGRVPVGIDVDDPDFNVVGKNGGSKYLQRHTHKSGIQPDTVKGIYAPDGNTSAKVYWNNGGIESSPAGTGESGNLQPYTVVAFWRRVE